MLNTIRAARDVDADRCRLHALRPVRDICPTDSLNYRVRRVEEARLRPR